MSPGINVLSIAILKYWNQTWCGRENWANGKCGKLNQYTFKCRNFITHECPCVNVLSIETSSFLNVETEPMMKWCGDRENEPMENLHLGNEILASAIMNKSINMHHTQKISNYA